MSTIDNKISATLIDADKDSIMTKLDEIVALLPFLISLTIKERGTLRKMGPKSAEFVELAVQGAVTYPNAMTKGFDTDEFKKDAQLHAQLLPIQVKMQSIMELMNDTFMAVGSDSFITAEDVYDQLKKAAKKDTGAKALVEKMSLRYKGQGKKKTTPKP